MRKYALSLLSLGIWACQPTQEAEEKQWNLTEIAAPAPSQSGEPNLFVTKDGNLYLSWVEKPNEREHALSFVRWEESQWSSPRRIAQDSGWFVNWADFPSMAVQSNFMAAHWLDKSTEDTFDYDVKVSISEDEGANWSEPFVLHRDGLAAEHGFVSMLPYEDKIFAVWLDGRFTKSQDGEEAQGHEHGGHGQGAMTLHTTTFDRQGAMGEEVELDHRICDCCQTDAVISEQGPVVVYRNRTEDEVRDIYITRQLDGRWTEPQPVHQDHWQIKACPVNGPAIAASRSKVAVAWFTAADNTPKVQLSVSVDGGASFGKALRIDHGNPLGRVDVIYLENGNVMLSWLEGLEDGAEIRAVLLDEELNKLADRSIINTAASRSSGFPIMERTNDKIFFAWTHAGEETSEIKSAFLEMKDVLP